MKIHITTSGTVYSRQADDYAYSYHCSAVSDTYTLPDFLDSMETIETGYPEVNTFHTLVDLNLAGLNTHTYLFNLEQHLNNNFKKRMPNETEIPAIHSAVTYTMNASSSSSQPLDTIIEEEDTNAYANALNRVQKAVQAFVNQHMQEAQTELKKNPAQLTQKPKQGIPQTPQFIQPPLSHQALLSMARTDIDRILSGLTNKEKTTSGHLALTHFRAKQVSPTPMTFMMYLGNELRALTYPELHTPEESFMLCQQAIRNLNAMLASPHLTNPDLTAFINTVKTHVQDLARAFDAQVTQEAEQTVSPELGGRY